MMVFSRMFRVHACSVRGFNYATPVTVSVEDIPALLSYQVESSNQAGHVPSL